MYKWFLDYTGVGLYETQLCPLAKCLCWGESSNQSQNGPNHSERIGTSVSIYTHKNMLVHSDIKESQLQMNEGPWDDAFKPSQPSMARIPLQ